MYAGHRGQHRRKLHQQRKVNDPLPWQQSSPYYSERELKALPFLSQEWRLDFVEPAPTTRPKARYAVAIIMVLVILMCVLLLLLGR